MREKNPSMEFANKTALAYSAVCKPLRHIKANLVSVNVDKLVHEGLLTRCPVPNDRRKTELLCTEKAQPIIQRGRALQETFFDRLLNGIDEARLNVFYGTLEQMGRNLDEILEGEL